MFYQDCIEPPGDVLTLVGNASLDSSKRLLTPDQATKGLQEWGKAGKNVVRTNGFLNRVIGSIDSETPG